MHRKAAEQVRIQLIEADVEIGFGLVDDAMAYRMNGRPELCSRALHDATDIVADIELRMQKLPAMDADSFLPLVAELRNEIAAVERAEF